AEIHSVASFYDLFRLEPTPPVSLHVCDDIACRLKGADSLCAGLEKSLGKQGAPCLDGKAAWHRSPCLGLCERAPAALLISAGKAAKELAIAPASEEFLVASVRDSAMGNTLKLGSQLPLHASLPQFGQPQLRLLRRVRQIDPANLSEFQKAG